MIRQAGAELCQAQVKIEVIVELVVKVGSWIFSQSYSPTFFGWVGGLYYHCHYHKCTSNYSYEYS